MTPQSNPVTAAHDTIRHRRARTLLFSVAITAFVAVVASADAGSIAIVAPSLALAMMLLLRADEEPNRLLLLPTVVVGVATLVWAALTGASPAGSVAVAVAAGITIEARVSRRIPSALLVLAAIVAVSALALTTGSPNALGTTLQLSFVAGIWLLAILDMGSEQRLFRLLEQAKDTERELSLTQERNRFAADLHDIQGHTLHVIKLKAAVAANLQDTDPERAAEELKAIQRLTAETIRESRTLAEATHELPLASELHNVVELLDATGVDLSIHQPTAKTSSAYEALLAQGLREATTNLLRHARPKHVQITIGADHLAVANDGAPTTDEPLQLQGLDTLRQRIGAKGGVLTIDHKPPQFIVHVSFAGDGTP